MGQEGALGTRLCSFLNQFPGANSPFHSQTKTFVGGFTSDHAQCLPADQKNKTGCGDENVTKHPCNHAFPDKNLSVPLNGTGTGTWGLGRWDACTGTSDSGARDKGLQDVKLLGCGDAKYEKWESHVKYGTRPQAKYRTRGRNCTSLLSPEPAFNVRKVNSFCYMKTFMLPLYMVFTRPTSSSKSRHLSETKTGCSLASWSHSIVN